MEESCGVEFCGHERSEHVADGRKRAVFHVLHEDGEGRIAGIDEMAGGALEGEASGEAFLHRVHGGAVVAGARQAGEAMGAGESLVGREGAPAYVAPRREKEIYEVVEEMHGRGVSALSGQFPDGFGCEFRFEAT